MFKNSKYFTLKYIYFELTLIVNLEDFLFMPFIICKKKLMLKH